nr:unnamed protein product [Callosobruchus analis]
MGRKQIPKPNDARLSQTSIEDSIQNLKTLSRKQMERKLMPDIIINLSSDDEYIENVKKKSHYELGIQKFACLPFSIDSDEDNDIYSERFLKDSPRVTPVKPRKLIGVNRPVASSTPLVLANLDTSPSLQQSPIGNGTYDTTIKNTSSAYVKSTIRVLEDITLTPSKTKNRTNEIRRTSTPTVSEGNDQNISAANILLPQSSFENVYDIVKQRNYPKDKSAAKNKNGTKDSQPQQLNETVNEAVTSNACTDSAKVKKKRATSKKQNDADNSGGSPRKITKIEHTPGASSLQNSSMNVAHLASCDYDKGITLGEPKTNSTGSNQPSENGDEENSICSASKKRKTQDKDEPNISPSESESVFKLEVEGIKLRNQLLVKVGVLPNSCNTTELQALLNQDVTILRNPTQVEKSNVSEKTSMEGTAANDVVAALGAGEPTRRYESSANTSLTIQRPSKGTGLSDVKVNQVTKSSTTSLSELNCEEGSSKQTDAGSSSRKTHTVPIAVQSTTETAVTKDSSASVSSSESSLEKSPYKRISSQDEAQKQTLSTPPVTPKKGTTVSPNINEQTPTKCCDGTVSNLEKSQTRTITGSTSSFEKTPTKSSNSTSSNFERTPTKRRLFRRSPRKVGMSPKSPKKQSKSTNSKHLELIKEKVFNVLTKSVHAKDIVKDELVIMEQFFKLDVRYQYFCLKLFTYQWKWYNVHKFCKTIDLEMDDNEIATMYEYLKDNGYVETDFEKSEDVPHLLQILDCMDLRSICNTFKLNSRVTKKDEMIALLLKYCKTQCTLTSGKCSRDLLLQRIKDKMGASIKVKDQLRLAFYRLYTMATFSNILFEDIQEFFKHMLRNGVLYPEYDVAEALVFWNRKEFLDYVDGVEEHKLLNKYFTSKRHVDVLAHCRNIFEKLKKLSNGDEDSQRYIETPHLKKFTAKSMYLYCLSEGCECLRAKFPEDVRVWLEYFIKNFTTYCTLCLIYMSKEKNYKKATDLILQAFTQHQSHLNETQKFLLSERAEMLKCSKKYKIDQLDHDKLAKFVPERVRQKRHYVVQDKDGSSSYFSVENIALQHYIDECGYTDGEHCEGGIVKALFNLLFWDIIYNPKRPVPATFISKLQDVPLDFYTTYFYQNRQEEIDKRIEDIRSLWTDAALLAFARRQYELHSHENSMCLIQNHITNADMLNVLIPCIGRQVLADILKRLVKDIRQYGSGLPDLMVWNAKEQKCKFVEVKGENDRLSAGQNLWINYLKSIGANVEVAMVHSIGSKRKTLKGSIKQSESMLNGKSATP